jgi:flagellum-specific ATP synthase
MREAAQARPTASPFQHLACPRGTITVAGRVVSVDPTGVQIVGLSRLIRLGDFVRFEREGQLCLAEAVSVNANRVLVKPLQTTFAIELGMAATYVGAFQFNPCEAWLGRCISALAQPIDGLGDLASGNKALSLQVGPVLATQRTSIKEGVATGVRVIDVFTPICFGQRIGIFAGSGVGKSTLLAMIANAPGFDVVVIALVGERGREVNEFIHDTLGSIRQKSVVVVATGDEAPAMRKLAPLLATRLAEFFRDHGRRVLLIMDSVTRYAMAAREIALAAGEPPVSRGYPPSVFSDLPQLLERAGPGLAGQGSITGIYSVLVDGDNHNEPVADTVRGILDGHIVLDREIANTGRYPAVHVLASLSRLANKAWLPAQAKLASEARHLIHRFEDSKDFRLLGNYQTGGDKELDHALDVVPKLYAFLTQPGHAGPDGEAFSSLARLLKPQRVPQAASAARPTN